MHEDSIWGWRRRPLSIPSCKMLAAKKPCGWRFRENKINDAMDFLERSTRGNMAEGRAQRPAEADLVSDRPSHLSTHR